MDIYSNITVSVKQRKLTPQFLFLKQIRFRWYVYKVKNFKSSVLLNAQKNCEPLCENNQSTTGMPPIMPFLTNWCSIIIALMYDDSLLLEFYAKSVIIKSVLDVPSWNFQILWNNEGNSMLLKKVTSNFYDYEFGFSPLWKKKIILNLSEIPIPCQIRCKRGK